MTKNHHKTFQKNWYYLRTTRTRQPLPSPGKNHDRTLCYHREYRSDGQTNTGTPEAGISAVDRTTNSSVTDTSPPRPPNVFYRFGAKITP
ncbi:MAG: hypothetical protein ABF379_12485 [Akkermansiaceae bacterium]